MNKAFIVCGPPGSGKTHCGRKLAFSIKAVFIDIDTVTERLVQHALKMIGQDENDRDSPYFKESFRETIYEQLFDIACENLPIQSVVIAGPFTKELRDSSWPESLSRRLKHPVEIHVVSCPPEVRKLRMIKRGNPRDLEKLKNWALHQSYYQNEDVPAFDHIVIDNVSDSQP